jgi:membrane-bound transcription factor site-1 protease
VPALNDLLAPYGIAFGDAVLEGQATIDGEQVYYASGANLVRFPAGGYVHALGLADKASTGVPLQTATCHPIQTPTTSLLPRA